jgi:cyclophilin family peptidyl-prolyl cis-trans isomerase
MVDRQLNEPFVVDTALGGDGSLRLELAQALGRIGDSRARADLERLLVGRQVDVRRAAAFALGQLGDPAASRALLRATRDSDPETGRLAVEALGRLGAELGPVREALDGLPPETMDDRLMPALFRFPGEQRLAVALQGLESQQQAVRSGAALALSRQPLPQAGAALRGLLADSDATIRSWAARALGRVGQRGDLDLLRPLLEDTAPGPVIQALRAAHHLVVVGRAAPSDDWRRPLVQLLDDPRAGVRITALEVAGAWLMDEELGARLQERVESGSGRERELALFALAAGDDPRGRELTARSAASTEASIRASAAVAAAILGDRQRLEALFSDSHGSVRLAVLPGLLQLPLGEAVEWAGRALEDADAAVRAGALEWLAEHPELPAEALVRAAQPMSGERHRTVDLILNLARALTSRGLQVPLERGLTVRLLEDLSRFPELAVRRLAADGLEELDQTRPAVGAVESGRTVEVYRAIVRQTLAARFVEVTTVHGRLRLRLDCPQAPLTCLNFLQLANQGFYDGLTFHRVVPDFVVQGGDPRGDGWGGPGFTIRDEMTRIRFRRGVLGMALSGPDTGGSQFFVTLSPQPHLDGLYSAFGEVVSGDEILDRIVQGDGILQIREVAGSGEGRE